MKTSKSKGNAGSSIKEIYEGIVLILVSSYKLLMLLFKFISVLIFSLIEMFKKNEKERK